MTACRACVWSRWIFSWVIICGISASMAWKSAVALAIWALSASMPSNPSNSDLKA